MYEFDGVGVKPLAYHKYEASPLESRTQEMNESDTCCIQVMPAGVWVGRTGRLEPLEGKKICQAVSITSPFRL
jgi:hypothetical protein